MSWIMTYAYGCPIQTILTKFVSVSHGSLLLLASIHMRQSRVNVQRSIIFLVCWLFVYIVSLFVYISKYHILCVYIGRDCNCAVQREVPRRRQGSSKGSHTPKCQVRWCHGAAHCERSHTSYHGGSNPARQQASQVVLRNAAIIIFKQTNTSFLYMPAQIRQAHCPH